jgi:phosphatidylglycerophosphate synthase
MTHSTAGEKGNPARRDTRRVVGRARSLAIAARALTLARAASVVPFAWLLVAADRGTSFAARATLVLAYAFIALSDFLDGRLARRGGAATAAWARADVAADVAFNCAGLAAAAWIGLVGPWVPAGVAILGGRFLWTIVTGDVREDARGKLAGVLFYALVGWAVIEVATGGVTGRFALARGGDAVFVYTIAVLLARSRPTSPRRG